MSDAVDAGRTPLLPLPGFMPDAVAFAFRLASAMLLAYLVSFSLQLSTAASAGICVAVVMQPTPGMALSKAYYRAVGTLAGGMAALVLVAAFPQDRTLLLAAFVVWMGVCSYTATILRDFRSYGAALAGYTVAIIAITDIDAPSGALLSTVNRVAAILVGIVSVALVNSVFVTRSSFSKLEAELDGQLDDLRRIAQEVLGNGKPLGDREYLQRTSAIIALRTEATYAASETALGPGQHRAGEASIAALLQILATTRSVSQALAQGGPRPPAQATRAYLDAVSDAIKVGKASPLHGRLPAEPLNVMLTERAGALADGHGRARALLRAFKTGEVGEALVPVHLRWDPDRVAASLNAARTMTGVGLGAVFCVLGGVSNVGQIIVQQAALLGLLATLPNPSKAAVGFLAALPVAALFAGVINFLLLPVASGFTPFALAVGTGVFILGLTYRHPLTAAVGPPLILSFAVLLAPSNIPSFDLSAFLNNFANFVLATLFTFAVFTVMLPVKPSRRLFRVTGKIVRSLRRTLLRGYLPGRMASPSLSGDRLSQAAVWAGTHKSGRAALLGRLCDFAELDASLCRVWAGLHDMGRAGTDSVDAVRAGLQADDKDVLEGIARKLLALAPSGLPDDGALLRAASGLYATASLMQRHRRSLRRYGVLDR